MRYLLLIVLLGISGPVFSQESASESDSVRQTDSTTITIQAPVVQIQVDTVAKNEKGKVLDEVKLTEPPFRVSLAKIIWSVIVFLIGYFLIRFLTRILGMLAERSTTERRITVKGFVPVVRIVGWIIVIYIIIAGIIRPPIETVLAFTASVAVAIGFASQDILKNIFGGIVILLDQPFNADRVFH